MENTNQPNSGNENTLAPKQVEMSQEALNALIDKKYAKGAEAAKAKLLEELGVDSVDSLKETIDAQKTLDEAKKTELDKANEQLEAIVADRDRLATEADKAKKQGNINSLAAQHGIKDVQYFEYLYNQQSGQEDFSMETLLEANPVLQGGVKTAPKTDTSSNKTDPSNNNYEGLSFKELVKLQQTL
jgi:hypothetical protein